MYYSVKDFADEIKDFKDSAEESNWPPERVVLEIYGNPGEHDLEPLGGCLRIEGGLKDDSLLDAKALVLVKDPSAEEGTLSWEDLSSAIKGKRSQKGMVFAFGDDLTAERAWLYGLKYDEEARELELTIEMIDAEELWL